MSMSFSLGQSSVESVPGLIGASIGALNRRTFESDMFFFGFITDRVSISAQTFVLPGKCSMMQRNALSLIAQRISLLAVCRDIPGFLPYGSYNAFCRDFSVAKLHLFGEECKFFSVHLKSNFVTHAEEKFYFFEEIVLILCVEKEVVYPLQLLIYTSVSLEVSFRVIAAWNKPRWMFGLTSFPGIQKKVFARQMFAKQYFRIIFGTLTPSVASRPCVRLFYVAQL